MINNDSKKPVIFALTGKKESGVWDVYTKLKIYLKASELHLLKAGENISVDSFLNSLIKGDIITAFADKKNAIWGLSITSLLTITPYIIILEPEQIIQLCECDKIEVFPIYVEVPLYDRLCTELYREDTDETLLYKMKAFIQDEEKHADIEEQMEEVNACFISGQSLTDLHSMLLDREYILQAIREYNEKYDFITNLDNFI